jgi:hypothetical protein
MVFIFSGKFGWYISKRIIFAPHFLKEMEGEERWESGLIQQFAKLSYGKLYRGFESPPLRRYFRGVAQSGSAPALGAGGPRFESWYPDLIQRELD